MPIQAAKGFAQWLRKPQQAVTRRGLFFQGGLAALLGAAGGSQSAASAKPLAIGPDLYESIGVKPVINCKGTFTIMSGSISLPEVKQAMLEASKHFVHIDELMDAVGARIAEITGAEAAIVTCGCASALAHATSACIAGGNPEKIQRMPVLDGMKNEVVAPDYSRNVYDHAVRMTGAKIIDVADLDQMSAAIGPQTAMVMVLASPPDTGPFGLEPITKLAHERGVPVLVDAAAEGLTIPNVHLERGADLVAYSGGKALRGPQSAGLLMGRKDLIKAAWTNSAPHHAFGRPMKVGKEDIMGMLAAVEMWVQRDHDAEWRMWESWLGEISDSVTKVDGVTTSVREPRGLSNYSPRLEIRWDPGKLGIYGEELERYLYRESDPRIVLGGASGSPRSGGDSAASIMPWQMQPGDATVVAKLLRETLANPPRFDRPQPGGAPASIAGYWDVEIDYTLSPAAHTLFLEQAGDQLSGLHEGDRTEGDARGFMDGAEMHVSSRHRWEGASFGFNFVGKVDGDSIEGQVDLGEYFSAPFRATRHVPGRRRQPPDRPQKNV